VGDEARERKDGGGELGICCDEGIGAGGCEKGVRGICGATGESTSSFADTWGVRGVRQLGVG
jgi:hypothetical protein